MIQVLCVSTELDEYGEVLAVGGAVDRRGERRPRTTYFGTELDELEWMIDRYAHIQPVRISGLLVGLAAVYVRLAPLGRNGWTGAAGSAWTEPLSTTADTRRPVRRVDWMVDEQAGKRPSKATGDCCSFG